MDTIIYEKINFLLSLLLVTIGIIVGFCLLFILIPNKSSLHNYKIARHIMGVAYFLLGIFMLGEIILLPLTDLDINLVRIIILTISSLLALSFTYSLITLINIRFFNKQNLIRELIPIACCSIACIIAYASFSFIIFIIILFIFATYYLSLLIRYTYLFYHTYKEYRKQMDNFFSEQEWKRLRWVNFAFYYALIVGIMAIFSIINFHFGFILFKLFIIPFYIYFGCQLINYSFKFQFIEPVFQEENMETKRQQISFQEVEIVIEKWVNQKKYLQAGITIEQVATELNTNRTYLSNYINNTKQQTFRKWINELRIEEAKLLLLKYPTLPASEIGKLVGFSDKSNFGRQFSQLTSTTPQNWRKKQQNT